MRYRSAHQTQSEEERIGQLIERICAVALVPLLAAFLVSLISGASAEAIALEFISAFILSACWWLVRRGEIKFAARILPLFGWIGGNMALLLFAELSPLLFVSTSVIGLLLAGALLGHRAIPVFFALTILGGAGLAAADAGGLVTMMESPSLGWLAAGSNFALVSFLIYYAFRIRHADLEQAEAQSAEAETLRQAAAVVSSSLQMEETIERILVQLEKVVPYRTASAQILREGALEIVGGRGWDEAAEVIGLQFPVPGDNPNTVVVETKQPYILDDAPEVYEAFKKPPHDHIRSYLGVPLIIGDELIGMLSIDHSQPGFYDPSHARLVQAFASQVAIAIENARHFQAERRRRQLAAMQQDITQVTSSSLELDEVLTRLALLTADAAKVQRCLILLFDGGGKRLDLVNIQDLQGPVPEAQAKLVERAFSQLVEGSGLAPALGDGRLQSLQRAALDEFLPPELRGQLEGEEFLLAPLVGLGGVLGLVAVVRLAGEESFSEEVRGSLRMIAQSAATSIENAQLYARVEEMAVTDRLTGMYNRHGLAQLAARELDRADRFGRPLSVLMLDLDHFKKLNDEHGHTVGDEILMALASHVEGSLRRIDLLSRYGGEEFVAVLPECNLEGGIQVAERVRAAVEKASFETEAGPLSVTVSVGVASSEGVGLDFDALIDAADHAMYAAKEAGRNRVGVWDADGNVATTSGRD